MHPFINKPPADTAGSLILAIYGRASGKRLFLQQMRRSIGTIRPQFSPESSLLREISGQITQDEYARKKRSFVEDKRKLQDELIAFERQGAKHSSDKTGVDRFEPVLGLINEAVHFGELAEGGKPDENREILKKIGSNFPISEKRVNIR